MATRTARAKRKKSTFKKSGSTWGGNKSFAGAINNKCQCRECNPPY